MFPALKEFCMEAPAQDLDVNKELSKCWVCDAMHLISPMQMYFKVRCMKKHKLGQMQVL